MGGWTAEQHIHMDTNNPVVVVDAGGKTAKITITDNIGAVGYKILNSSFTTISATKNTTIEWTIPAAGTYTVTVVDHAGNTGSVTFTVSAYNATNLIKNGSYENGTTDWYLSNASIVSGGYDGDYSLRFSYNNEVSLYTSMSTQTLSKTAPILNHNYYGSLMFKSSTTFNTTDSRFEWHYKDGTDGTMIYAYKNPRFSDWTKISSIKTITANTNLSNNWQIRNFQVAANEYSYNDSLILIDLTETFGSGNEPDGAWCNKHINYFDGTTTIYK